MSHHSLVTPEPGDENEKLVSEPDAGVAQLVEHQLPKLRVASSNLVARLEEDLEMPLDRVAARDAAKGQ